MEKILLLVAFVMLILLVIILVRLFRSMARPVADQGAELKVAEEKLRMAEGQLEQANVLIREKEMAIVELNRQLGQKTAENQALEEKYQKKLEEITKAEEKLQAAFKNLANEILEEKTQKFTEENKKRLDEILKPLGDKIREFEKKVEETYDKESKQRFSLEKEIEKLAMLNQQISADAKNLTVALRSDSKKQGNWGELVLERVLESSGLVKGLEYTREVATRSEEGDRYRPDVIVHLPDNKHIIIDSKVSLVSYNDFVNAENPEEKERHLKSFLSSVRQHVKGLSEKNYQLLEAFDTPDYVLLFMPIESCFSLALTADPELFTLAWDKHVVIVSPTTLLATLRTVASIWKHEKQTQNAIEIARQGGALYDKFVGFLEDMAKLGTQIENTQKTYSAAYNKLSEGSGNLVGRVEKLKALGAKASKDIPKNLLKETEEEK